ncbi:PIG-L family deacetylase [Actinospongicola halichondriae]|uniref:PIG-L family deacetylase n=1 Tax=Actinospongicola halichondriae TaxID=3236844 RepID=UPI003D58BA56
MATIVSFHAHPDDESIATGGTLARAAAEGHRVVLVFGTRGECGEVAEGFLADGEPLGERRALEVAASAEALGAHRFEFLGYRDSGMIDEPTNDAPDCFWQADVEEAAERLATILRDEQADVLTVYDDHGGYGHPDHIQVHRVGHRAAEIAGTPHVYESTMNRDHLRRAMQAAAADNPDYDGPDFDDPDSDFGSPESLITTTVDVTDWLDAKRASMAAHASQIPDDSFFLAMPPEAFAMAFGHEWFIRTSPAAPGTDDWLLPTGVQ